MSGGGKKVFIYRKKRSTHFCYTFSFNHADIAFKLMFKRHRPSSFFKNVCNLCVRFSACHTDTEGIAKTKWLIQHLGLGARLRPYIEAIG